MSNDDEKTEEGVEVPSAEVIHLALVRERFQKMTARQGIVEEHDEAPVVVYVELMRGLETWAANTLCVDMERVRRGELSLEDELRDPVNDFERLQILRVLREMHNELAEQWGLD